MKTELKLFGRRISMASRSRRRRLVVLIYIGLVVWIAGFWFIDDLRGAAAFICLPAILVNRFLLGGYFFGGLVKKFLNPELEEIAEKNDERELRQRDSIHFIAYRFLAIMTMILMFLLGAPIPGHRFLGLLTIPTNAPLVLAIAGVFVSLTLPQALLLWNERDMEEEA